MSLLCCREIKKTFRRGGQSFRALNSISLEIEEGESLGIVGESGCGKSTLLRIIAGLDKPDSGEVLLRGNRLGVKRSREELRCMQLIFQNANGSFNPRRRVISSILENAQNLTGSASKKELEPLIRRVGIEPELLERYPSRLSGGQCQRLAIARALAVRPELLLCDEITSALDVTTQKLIVELLRELRAEYGMSMLFVSHDLAVVGQLCDRIIVMLGGEIVEQAPSRELLRNPREEYTKKLISSVLEVKKPC